MLWDIHQFFGNYWWTNVFAISRFKIEQICECNWNTMISNEHSMKIAIIHLNFTEQKCLPNPKTHKCYLDEYHYRQNCCSSAFIQMGVFYAGLENFLNLWGRMVQSSHCLASVQLSSSTWSDWWSASFQFVQFCAFISVHEHFLPWLYDITSLLTWLVWCSVRKVACSHFFNWGNLFWQFFYCRYIITFFVLSFRVANDLAKLPCCPVSFCSIN